MSSNNELLKNVKEIAEYYNGCFRKSGKQLMKPGDNPISSNTMIDMICDNTPVEPIEDSYGLIYYRPTHDKTIEGQYKQENDIFNKQLLPVKIFKYLRTKIK